MFGRVCGTGWRRHQRRQPRVLGLERPRSGRDGDVKGAGNDAVRVDVAAVGATGLQQVDPQAVEFQRFGEVEMTGFGERLHLSVEQTLQVREGRVAPRQVVEARIAGVAAIAVRAAPAAARPVLRSVEHTSALHSLMRISYAVFCFKKYITPTLL